MQTLALVAVVAIAGRAVLWGAAMTISHLAAFESQYEVRLRLTEHFKSPASWLVRWPSAPAKSLAQLLWHALR